MPSPDLYAFPPLNTTRKPVLIVDFVSHQSMAQEERVIGGEGGTEIILKTPSQRPKLRDISPTSWVTANSNILQRLMETGQVTGQGVTDYLAYTAKVGQLGSKFTWNSVLAYDNEYRHLQAEHGFRLATDIQHLAYTIFVMRPPAPSRAKGPTHTAHTSGGARPRPNGQEICRNFNVNRCQRGTSCHFRHVCNRHGCGQPHAGVDHDKTGQ